MRKIRNIIFIGYSGNVRGAEPTPSVGRKIFKKFDEIGNVKFKKFNHFSKKSIKFFRGFYKIIISIENTIRPGGSEAKPPEAS